jgi:hypothetical protein
MANVYEYRTRQYDDKIAIWTKLPIIHDGELEYHYPARNTPNVKTPFTRWVCIHVAYTKEEADSYLGLDTKAVAH